MKKPKIFPGWLVVIATFMANFMAPGMAFYSFNAWLEPICELHGWSRTDINIVPSLGVAIGLISQVFYGRLVRKYGARILMMAGAFLSGASFALMGKAHTLPWFYLFATLLFIGNGAFHGIVPNTAVSYWFEKKRGKAMGLSIMAVSLSGVLIPPFALFLIKRYDLPTMFLIIGLLTWLLVITPTALFMKSRPEDYGLVPDGDQPETQNQVNALSPNSCSQSASRQPETINPKLATNLPPVSYFLRSPAFWLAGTAFGLAMMPVVGVMIQLKPRFSDLGFSDQTAMTMMVLTALLGTAGKYGWARLCDSFNPSKVVAVSFLFQTIGLTVLVFAHHLFSISIFILLFGFGMGGVVSTFPIVVAHFFGRENFPKVYGYISLFLLLQIGGYILMGRSFDLFGSYNYAYLAFIIIDTIALALILLAKKWEKA